MSEILGFGLLFLAPVTAFTIWHNRAAIRAFINRQPVNLDALDAHTHRPADANPSTGSAGRCPNCRRQVTGLAWVIIAPEFGGGIERVCHGCSGVGLYKGWYRAQLPRTANVYDIATALDTHDLDDIEQYANGGDVA